MDQATATPIAGAGFDAGGRAAGRAVVRALDALGRPASLVMAFPSGLHPAVAAESLRSVGRGFPIVGMTGNGAIGCDGAIERGCAALAFDASLSVGIGVTHDAKRAPRAAARAATHEALMRAGSGEHRIVLLLLDTRSGDQSYAVAGAYEAAGPDVPLAGGAAGGREAAQIVGGDAIRESVIAVAINSPEPIGIGSAHGCRVRAMPAIVTRSEDGLVHELDGRPAVRVYLERLGYSDLALDDEEFEALAVTHPLSQPELRGTSHVCHVLGRRGDALQVATHIPATAAVEFTHETPEDIVAASSEAVGSALGALPDGSARAALLFDCAGRKRAVAGSLSHEVSALLGAFPDTRPPLAGLFTHGEIARTSGAKGDLNHAIIAVAFG